MAKEKAYRDWAVGYNFHANPKLVATMDAFMAGWSAKEASLSPAEEKVPYQEIIDLTNRILEKKYKLTPGHKSQIKARWQEGMRLEDFENVCNIKKAQWGSDPDMRMYLRIETLYGTKMDSYNNEAPPKKTIEEWQ